MLGGTCDNPFFPALDYQDISIAKRTIRDLVLYAEGDFCLYEIRLGVIRLEMRHICEIKHAQAVPYRGAIANRTLPPLAAVSGCRASFECRLGAMLV